MSPTMMGEYNKSDKLPIMSILSIASIRLRLFIRGVAVAGCLLFEILVTMCVCLFSLLLLRLLRLLRLLY